MFTYLAGQYVSNLRNLLRFSENCNGLCLEGRMLIYGCDFGNYKSSLVQCDVFPFSMKRKQYIYYVYHCPICFAMIDLLCKGHAYVCTRTTDDLLILKQNKPDYCSKVSYMWARIFRLYSVVFDAHLAGRLVPYKLNKAWRWSSLILHWSMCIERMIFDIKWWRY